MPEYRFNRVDGLHLGGIVRYPLSKQASVQAGGGYSFSSRSADYVGGLRFTIAGMPRITHQLRYDAKTQTRYESITSSQVISSTNMIMGNPDYFDYYRSEGVSWNVAYRRPRSNRTWEVQAKNEKHSSVEKVTDYSLFRPATVQRPNPAIEDGWMRSVSLTLTNGDDLIPFAIVGQNRLQVRLEVSDPEVLKSDYRYAKVSMAIDRRFPTFFKRRFLPNTLDARLTAGTSTGNLPLQRFGVVDASPTLYAPYGSLKSLREHPYEGEHYVALHWEHNFRTIPFEALGMMWFARKGWSLLAYGSHARTYISDERLAALSNRPDYVLSYHGSSHHEVGVALNGIFGLGRINITKRLDKPGLFYGFGVARYF